MAKTKTEIIDYYYSLLCNFVKELEEKNLVRFDCNEYIHGTTLELDKLVDKAFDPYTSNLKLYGRDIKFNSLFIYHKLYKFFNNGIPPFSLNAEYSSFIECIINNINIGDCYNDGEDGFIILLEKKYYKKEYLLELKYVSYHEGEYKIVNKKYNLSCNKKDIVSELECLFNDKLKHKLNSNKYYDKFLNQLSNMAQINVELAKVMRKNDD